MSPSIKQHFFTAIKITLCLTVIISVMFSSSSVACGVSADIGKTALNIETYAAGKNQCTHPAVISFDKPWHSYKYWMAYTPYPNADGEEENPCIAVSNDLYKWTTPYGMVNPISSNEELGCDELKDTHILYRDDLKRIEVWYLGRQSVNLGGDGKSLLLLRKYTYDGKNWSKYEVMSKTRYLSPTINWENGKYRYWGIGYSSNNTAGTFVCSESSDGKHWSAAQPCSVGGKESAIKMWHGAVTYNDGVYHLVYIDSNLDAQSVKYGRSSDGIHFVMENDIVRNSKGTLWKRLYRPDLLICNDEYILFYGVITANNEWYISMSRGKDIHTLSGISASDASKMTKLTTAITDTNSWPYKLQTLYNSIQKYIHPEVLLLIPFCLIFMHFNKKWQLLLNFAAVLIVCTVYSFCRYYPLGFWITAGVVAAAFIECFAVYGAAYALKTIFKKSGAKSDKNKE